MKAQATLIEGHRTGGDCPNSGCLPSKALIRSDKTLPAPESPHLRPPLRAARRVAQGFRWARAPIIVFAEAPAAGQARMRLARALDGHDAVLVPALDGGCALVGQRRAAPRWFADMAWSHPRVMADTRERLRAAGVRRTEPEPVADIDEPADLPHSAPRWLEGPETMEPGR